MPFFPAYPVGCQANLTYVRWPIERNGKAAIYRCNEYPDSSERFEQEGHHEACLLAASQSTKIGRETFVIQNDPRESGQEFICALNSVQPRDKWPFTNIEQLPQSVPKDDEHYGWGPYEMMFGDVGCMYFMIDKRGNVTWESDCY